jgi:hypothetical protein
MSIAPRQWNDQAPEERHVEWGQICAYMPLVRSLDPSQQQGYRHVAPSALNLASEGATERRDSGAAPTAIADDSESGAVRSFD